MASRIEARLLTEVYVQIVYVQQRIKCYKILVAYYDICNCVQMMKQATVLITKPYCKVKKHWPVVSQSCLHKITISLSQYSVSIQVFGIQVLPNGSYSTDMQLTVPRLRIC
jgi:hypothetical protein